MNVPELIAMFRSVADVALKDDLRAYMTLPAINTGKRQIVTAPASSAFRAYQKVLDTRIKLIEERKGPPEKGDDILLAVITDGRHAAIDLRFVEPDVGSEAGNKLNKLVANVHRIWVETSTRRYVQPGCVQSTLASRGVPERHDARLAPRPRHRPLGEHVRQRPVGHGRGSIAAGRTPAHRRRPAAHPPRRAGPDEGHHRLSLDAGHAPLPVPAGAADEAGCPGSRQAWTRALTNKPGEP